jgi:hypothetical protein
MSPYRSSLASASEFSGKKKLELNNWISYMLEQYTDMSNSGIKTELHFLCMSASKSLMRAAGIPHNNQKMELCMGAKEL